MGVYDSRHPSSRTTSWMIRAAVTRSLTSSHSWTVWMSRMPLARLATWRPRLFNTLASQPPPLATVSTANPRLRAASWTR